MKLVPQEPSPEHADEVEAALATLRRVATEGTGDRRRMAARAVRAADQKRRQSFMRVWPDREQEIREDLEALAERRRADGKPVPVSVLLTMDVLRNAVYTMTSKSQRMTKTQAELRVALGLTAAQISAAFAALREVGAVLDAQHQGKSITWEIDAEYASQMSDPDLDKAAKAQAQKRAEAKKKAAAEASRKRHPPMRLVPGGMDGITPTENDDYDARQLPLID